MVAMLRIIRKKDQRLELIFKKKISQFVR